MNGDRADGTGRLRLVLLAALVIASRLALKGTLALDLGQTQHAANTSDPAAIYDPNTITSAPVNNTESVSWTDPGHNHGNGNGYAILAYHEGPASTACSTTQANYTFVKGVSNITTPPFVDNGVFAGSNANYYASYTCYMVRTWEVPGVSPASWPSGTVPTWTSQIAPVPCSPLSECVICGTPSPESIFKTRNLNGPVNVRCETFLSWASTLRSPVARLNAGFESSIVICFETSCSRASSGAPFFVTPPWTRSSAVQSCATPVWLSIHVG